MAPWAGRALEGRPWPRYGARHAASEPIRASSACCNLPDSSLGYDLQLPRTLHPTQCISGSRRILLSEDVSVKKDAAPPLAADANRMNRRERSVRGRHESPLFLEPNESISLSTPRDPATGRRRSEVRPEVGLPEAPLEREDD